jgi:MYXO-CTERM domain-containing protein
MPLAAGGLRGHAVGFLPPQHTLNPAMRYPKHPVSPSRASLQRPASGLVAAAAGVAATLLLAPARADAAPHFAQAPSALPQPQPCGGSGCYTHFVVLADLEGDGDLDFLLANGGGFYQPAQAEPATVYLNKGDGTFTDVNASAFGGVSSRVRQVALGDVDGDGDLDVYLPGSYGLDRDRLFVQGAPGAFADESATRLPFELSSRGPAAHFGDVDGDGDLDLAVTDWGNSPFGAPSRVRLMINDGAGKFTALPFEALPPPLPVGQASAPIDVDLQDVDGDFDLDLIVDNRNGRSRLFVNDGAGNFTDQTANFPPKNGPYAYNNEACDVDGDGDLDLLIDNAGANHPGSHRSQVLINDGAGKFVDETAARIVGEPNTDDNGVKCVDVDNDGDYDLVVASLGNGSEKLLLNDGTAKFTYVPDAFSPAFDPTLGIDVGDVNGDGVLDVVTGQGEGGDFKERVYYGGNASKRDTRPPVFRAVEAPSAAAGQPVVVRLAVRDSHTSETGQHLTDASIAYTVLGGGGGTAKARFIGGDLYRVELPPQPAGAQLTLVPSAVDRAGNVGTGSPVEITIGTGSAGSGGAGGGAGTGGSGGGAGAGGSGGSGTGGVGGNAGAGGDAGTGGEGGAGGTGGEGGAGGSAGSAGAGGAGGSSEAGAGGAGGSSEAGAGGSSDAGAGGVGDAGAGGAGGPSGAAGSSTAGQGGMASGSGGAGGVPKAGSAGGIGNTPTAPDDDDGCGCAVPGQGEAPPGAPFLFAALAALGLRRRRTSERA